MGCNCCNPNLQINELDLIKDLDEYIKYLINQIKRIENEIKKYEKNNPYIKIESETPTVIITTNEEKTINKINKNNNNEHVNLETYQFYLTLYKALLQIKIILDDYINFLDNEEDEKLIKKKLSKKKLKFNIKKYKSIYKYNYDLLEFDVDNSKILLKNLLNTEENYDILTIQRLSKENNKYLFKTNKI